MSIGNVQAQLREEKKEVFVWDTLPSLPDTTGFAGSFAGVTDDVLIVAGGSNFPNGGTPWNGGTKTWYNKIFVMEKPEAEWTLAGTLPFNLGYGVSVSTNKGLLMIGGSNEAGHVADVFLVRFRDRKVEQIKMPSLPFALANASGALVGKKVFVAGGLASPSSSSSEKKFLCLDLDEKNSNWKELPPWPGPSRMLAVAGASGNCFFLFSGTELKNGNRTYLRDAYSFSEAKGWTQLKELPFPVVAAPSPAFHSDNNEFFIFGGDSGKDAAAAASLKENHPGFSNEILRYNVKEDKWSITGKLMTQIKVDAADTPNNSIWAPVTTPLAVWKARIVLPGGEVRPGTRTPRVLTAKPLTD
ncbi:galactose oxidase [Flavisolibacter sp. BT320]|nr:galactose oxidase [Flavisolibacter longurius]